MIGECDGRPNVNTPSPIPIPDMRLSLFNAAMNQAPTLRTIKPNNKRLCDLPAACPDAHYIVMVGYILFTALCTLRHEKPLL